MKFSIYRYGILTMLIAFSFVEKIVSTFSIKGYLFFRLSIAYIIEITAIDLFYLIIKPHRQSVNIKVLDTYFTTLKFN